MAIRDGSPFDLDAVRRIARESFDRLYAYFATRGVRGAWPFLLAEQEGRPAGYLVGRWFDGSPSIGYVYFVAVDSESRRHGVGHALVAESLRRFAVRGATRVFAAVPDDNEASLGLFRSLGFEQAPRRALWRWYGWRGLSVEMRMLLAPHETLLVHTFTDPSPG
ncbi:MAG: GNAT family N-acetyltransferase, partial [Thermoplasmata archaeon]